MNTITTTIHVYRFDTSKPAQAAEHTALMKKLRKTPGRGHWMHCLGSHDKDQTYPLAAGESAPITLETGFLFANQWNEETPDDRNGWRVFDWYEAIWPNASIKTGHYLDITQEMIDVRRDTLQCGYCGKHYQTDQVFCSKCTGSEYLKETDLHLLRLLPVDGSGGDRRAKLTDDELSTLGPAYIAAQAETRQRWIDGQAARLLKKRDQLIEAHKNKLEKLADELCGKVWLLNNGIDTDNVIYYSYTKRFCFGWREPVDKTMYSKLCDVLCEAPFDYDIKAAKGAKPWDDLKES